MDGGGINQLKEQLEASQVAIEATLKEIEAKYDKLGINQEEQLMLYRPHSVGNLVGSKNS